MKIKVRLVLLALLIASSAFGKKVRFAVDMRYEFIMQTGIHMAGDFQTLLGYPTDWDSGSLELTQEGATSIYSVVLDLPAFQKYEFKFVNGIHFYEVEFLSATYNTAAVVAYENSENRWLYVGDDNEDTLDLGNIVFSSNAPLDQFAVRARVDMEYEEVQDGEVYIEHNFNGTTQKDRMFSFFGTTYEFFTYVEPGTYEYSYYNGDNQEDTEDECGTVTRSVTVSKDTILDELSVQNINGLVTLVGKDSALCFNACTICSEYTPPVTLDVSDNDDGLFTIYPTISSSNISIEKNPSVSKYNFALLSSTGSVLMKQTEISNSTTTIEKGELSAGTYILAIEVEGEGVWKELVVFQ